MNITKEDLECLKEYGLSLEKVFEQLEAFTKGVPFVDVITAASLGNGIENISKEDQEKLILFYEEKSPLLEIVKFVPASGAATRMFQFLFQFLEEYDSDKEILKSYILKNNRQNLSVFVASIKDFAFLNAVKKKIRENHLGFKHGTKGVRARLFVETMLDKNGLNYSNLPKGLIPFHKYKKHTTTAFEEHLYESAFYASVHKNAFLHFTFSKNHLQFFKKEFEKIKKRVTKKTKTEFHISYSFQEKETNTIAVNDDNTLFRDINGKPVLRPSGHGALIENLNNLNADVIFIKNIDNVISEEYISEIVHYKKMLGGKLIWLQEKIFTYLKLLMQEKVLQETIIEIKTFLWNELNIKNSPNNVVLITKILNRPLRVCGVVKNTGAPGGGPFWIKNDEGEISLQIVEMSQIDTKNLHQQSIINDATHFNPVDIVCGIKDYKGDKFDLSKFVDPKMGIITQKHQDGKPLKALELPGLWNGAMAGWNSAFVEVPLITFNPVKTVNDLLNKEHRPTTK